MTKVTVIKPDQQKNMTPLSEGKHGKWYKISKYEPNPYHVGQIGIMIPKDCTGLEYDMLIAPDGHCYSHSAIFIEELSEVTITVKE